MRRVEASDTEPGPRALLLDRGHCLLGDERAVCDPVAAPAGQGALGKTLWWVRDGIAHVHRAIPCISGRRQTGADGVELVRRGAAHPGAVGILVRTGFVGDLQLVEAVIGMR